MGYGEFMELQTTLIARIGERLDTKGYAAIVRKQTNADSNSKVMPYQLAIAVERAVYQRARDIRHYPILIIIEGELPLKTATKLAFACRIPRRARYRLLHAALLMMSTTYNEYRMNAAERAALLQSKRLLSVEKSDYVTYRGTSYEALGILIQHLEMPHFREVMTP